MPNDPNNVQFNSRRRASVTDLVVGLGVFSFLQHQQWLLQGHFRPCQFMIPNRKSIHLLNQIQISCYWNLSCPIDQNCGGERGNLRRRAAEEADLEVLEAVLDGRLSFYCALQFYDCPFWAISFTAIALDSNLHSSFPFLFLCFGAAGLLFLSDCKKVGNWFRRQRRLEVSRSTNADFVQVSKETMSFTLWKLFSCSHVGILFSRPSRTIFILLFILEKFLFLKRGLSVSLKK